jgi:hypothetical protein
MSIDLDQKKKKKKKKKIFLETNAKREQCSHFFQKKNLVTMHFVGANKRGNFVQLPF